MMSTKERARGRWREILPALGISDGFLTGRNCPCPICGGRDRFRFIDRQPGDGMWICNQCQPHPRPAIDLAIAFTGKPFREAARTIDDILGDKPVLAQTSIRPIEQKASKYYHQKVWKRGVPIRPGDIADRYMRNRGVGMDIYAPCLRFSKLDWYYEDDLQYLPVDTERFSDRPDIAIPVMRRAPAMLALVTNPAGKHVATHKTFLADDASGKADISKPRKVVGKHGKGPTIRLMPTAPLMGIAEGIETAISAARLFRIPVWSVLNAGGIESFEPPSECEHLIVFADHDPHGVSQRAAKSLCDRLQFPTEIKMPGILGTDWNDVLTESSR
jgi:putative DNA primase/helicase